MSPRGRRLRHQLVLAVLSVAILTPGWVGGIASAADGALSATATPNEGEPGTSIDVVGAGWPANAQVQLSTCGGLAIEGSNSCDARAVTAVGTDAKGRFEVNVALGKPPRPCPCVIHVMSMATPRVVDIPVTVTGIPVAELPESPPTVSSIQLVDSEVQAPFSWAALFGAAAPRVLQLTYRNTGALPGLSPTTTLTVEPLGGATRTLSMPAAVTVPAGGESTVVVPFDLDPGIGGTYLVRGTIPGQPSFSHQTSSWAWGFFALDAILFLLLVLVLVTKALRARRPEPQRGTRHAGRDTPSPGRHRASANAAGLVHLDELYSTE